MNELVNLTASEISVKIDEKEREYLQALNNYHTVEQAKLNLQKEILEKQLAKKDLEIAVDKARHNVQQIVIDLKLMKSAFWSARDNR